MARPEAPRPEKGPKAEESRQNLAWRPPRPNELSVILARPGSAENDTRPVKSRVVQASGRNFPSRLFDPWRRPIGIYRLRLRGRRRLPHRGGRFGGGLIRRCWLLVGIDRLRWRRRFAHRRL